MDLVETQTQTQTYTHTRRGDSDERVRGMADSGKHGPVGAEVLCVERRGGCSRVAVD